MMTHEQIDSEIRRLTGESELSRPFLCSGSPIGCDVAEVGINPGTDTPFWPYWSIDSGCDKYEWINEYRKRKAGKRTPTRDRIEELCIELQPLRCLELNLYHHYSPSEASLAPHHRNTEVFDFMLKVAKPQVLLVHGAKPLKYLQRVLGIKSIEEDHFTPAVYHGTRLEIFAAKSHFRRVEKKYVKSIAAMIKTPVAELKSQH